MFQSGKRLLVDTKTPRDARTKSKMVKGKDAPPPSSEDAHASFIKYCIKEKPNKKEVVEYFKKFISEAEAKL